MTRDPVKIQLNTELQTCDLKNNLKQGSTNREFKVTLMSGERKILLDDANKISVVVVYNPRVEYDKFVYDGSFVLESTTANYNITRSKETVDGEEFTLITIPFWENFVSYAGKCKLIINVIDDTGSTDIELYTYSMPFTVDMTDAYIPKSIPNNLPSYTHLETRIKQLETDTAVTEQKATTNADAITRKADDNLANVGNFAIAPEGSIIIKKGGTLDHEGITVIGENINAPGKIINAKRINVDSQTVGIGLITEIHEETGFLVYHTNTLNKNYVLLDYETDPITGTKTPIYWSRLARERQTIQSVKDQIMQNVKTINFGTASFSRQVQNIYLEFLAPVNNLKVEVVINGKPLIYYPSKLAWDGKENGYNTIQTGLSQIKLDPFLANLTDYSITFNLKADNPINLKGDGTTPYYELDLNKIIPKKVLLEGDVVVMTPEEVRNALQSLSGDDRLGLEDLKNVEDTISGDYVKTKLEELTDESRLDASAIKNIPSSGDPDLIKKVDSNTTELNRLKTDISTGGLGIFVFRDRGLPVIPTDKQYKAYYIHILVLQDSTGVINIPANTPNGAIFSVENNDRSDYVNIMPPSGQTINGKTGVYKCDFDTLNFIVKDGTDWKVGFAGVFPNNYDAMKSTIGTLFPNSLHTIPEVEAQLKDRLHTFREIQTEFSSQLHTEQEIKNLQDVMHFDTIANMNKVVPTENKVAIVDDDGNGFVGYYKYSTATSKWEDYNAQGVIMSDSNGAIPKLIKTAVYGPGFTIQQAGDREDAALITYTGSGTGGTEIDAVGDDGKTFKVSKIQSMDGKVAIRNLGGGVADLDADYNTVTDGIFAKLSMDEDINTDFHDQRPYFGDMYDNSGRYVGIDMFDKGFTIQEGDMLDPNVTGGSTFNIGMYFEPLDYNVVSNDGYVELKVIDVMTKDYLIDIDGNPVAIRREYKAGTQVGKELLLGIVRAKGQKKIAFEIDVQFGDQILRASSNTCIYIQEVDKNHNSGICELLFQRHTGYTINKIHRDYGVNNMNLAAALVRDKPQGDMENTSEMMGNGIFFDTRGKCKVEIKDYHIIMQDNGVDLPVFSLGKIWDEIDTLELRLKTLNAKIVITDKQNAFIYALMKWTGTGPATLPILTGYNNSVPIFASGWIKVSQKFISEDVVSGDHVDTNAFTVPNDAKQMAMIIYPNDTETPTVMKLKDFEVDINPSFTKTIIQNSSHITEEHLKYEKNMYKSTVYTPGGFQSYRYTVNNVDTKLPVGVIKSGDGKIINDNSWSDAGSSDPNKTQGDFKFLTDGEVTIDYQARCFNEQGSINQIQFWLAKVNDNGTFTEVPNSRYASTIEASRKVPKLINSQRFIFDVKANESYRFFGKSDKSDGFFVQSDQDGVPLLRFIIDFNEILENEQSILDDIEFLKEHANEVEFVKDGATVTNYKIKVDVDTSRISVVEKGGA